MDPILVPITALLIPITAIISATYFKVLKFKSNSITTEEKAEIQRLLKENQNLNHRLENLETIIAEVDMDLLKLHSHTKQTLPENKS